ncbi:MAG: CtkA family protein, partial [Ruminococcus sp.]|nr:CtkA family protein [Candidatus Copronaster equi]
LEDKAEMDFRIFEIPLSGIKEDGKKINYFKFISSLKNNDCNSALKRITPKIDMIRIDKMIDEMPYVDELQKTFYKTMLRERKEKILDKSLELLKKSEATNVQ